jgi:hypothetical protein
MASRKLRGRKMKTPCRKRTMKACHRAKRHCRRITRKNKNGKKRSYCRKRRSVH